MAGRSQQQAMEPAERMVVVRAVHAQRDDPVLRVASGVGRRRRPPELALADRGHGPIASGQFIGFPPRPGAAGKTRPIGDAYMVTSLMTDRRPSSSTARSPYDLGRARRFCRRLAPTRGRDL